MAISRGLSNKSNETEPQTEEISSQHTLGLEKDLIDI